MKKNADSIILYVINSPLSLRFIRDQFADLRKHGFTIAIACPPGEAFDRLRREEQIEAFDTPMSREIDPFNDLVTTFRLWRLMTRLRPAIVDVSTPKAGLVGGLAAVLARVPVRVYMLRTLRYETTKGLTHRILRWAEIVACHCAHRTLCVSRSLVDRAREWRLVAPERLALLANGSSHGVEVEHFQSTPERWRQAAAIRTRLAISPAAPVIGFVGRFTRDKGIPELVAAFLRILPQFPEARLLLVGDFEIGDPVPEDVRQRIDQHPAILHTGRVDDPAPYFHCMDFLALPSHREGFPNVVLEANAAARPVITTNATGCCDAVVNGETGITVPVGDAASLASAMEALMSDANLRQRLGVAAYNRVVQQFAARDVRQALIVQYQDLLQRAGVPLPDKATATRARSAHV